MWVAKPPIGLCQQCRSLLRGFSQARPLPPRRCIATSGPKSSPLANSKPATPSTESKRSQSSFSAHSNTPSPNDDYYVTSLGHTTTDRSRTLLKPNNLFHPFSRSPSDAIQRRATYMRHHAYCPHPSHQRTRHAYSPGDPEGRKPNPGSAEAAEALPPAHLRFECPDCGIPVYCSEGHWMDDFESHLEICDTLRQINEDDHDLRSGRLFPEFEYPEHQRAEEFIVNMSNWDTYLYTRDHPAIDDPRSLRQATRLLTYPVTIASVLHEFSPYVMKSGSRLTQEGLRSFGGEFCFACESSCDTRC